MRLLQSVAGMVEAMSEKPWLPAKTAGEAFALAFQHECMRKVPTDFQETVAQAVIEWHEAQRERTSEHWEVRSFKRGGVGQWVLATYLTRAELRAARECTAMLPIAMEHIARLEAGNAGKRPLALIGWRQAVQATKGDG